MNDDDRLDGIEDSQFANQEILDREHFFRELEAEFEAENRCLFLERSLNKQGDQELVDYFARRGITVVFRDS